jgi:predicted DNA-binding protein
MGKRGAPAKGDDAKRFRITVPMSRGVYVAVANAAATSGKTKADVVRKLIDDGVEEIKRRKVET